MCSSGDRRKEVSGEDGAARRLWGSERAHASKLRPGMTSQRRRQSRGGARGILSGAGCCTLRFEGTGGRGGWAFFWKCGHGEMLCAGCWKRGRLGPARECGERQ